MRHMRGLVLSGTLAIGLLFLLPVGAWAAAPATPGALSGAHPTASPAASAFNRPGDLLITDQFNNRVIEVNPLTKQIVWSFGSGNGTLCNPGAHSVIGANDAERLAGGLTLIAGTGIPSGVPNTTACADNRVIVVNQAGNIVWQYGQAGKTGSGFDLLNVPVFALQLPNHNFLIVDQGNNRIIEVNFAKKIVWSYGPTSGPGALNSPNSAEFLANGDLLVADEANSRVLEIAHNGTVVSQFSSGLNIVAFASRLPSGRTLIVDSGNNRVIEINAARSTVFQYFTKHSAGSNPAPAPTGAVEIRGGDIVIADQFNNRVIVIDSAKQIVFQYGQTNVAGNGFDQLYAPYSAVVIGDYTGQTVPPASFLGPFASGGD
jgi:hypothetical protein